MLSLYLHIPFCRRKCAYCAFYSAPADDQTKDRYLGAMTKSLQAAGGKTLDTLYLGGGTPALLGVERLQALLEQVNRCFSFAPDAERTVELNPESTTPQLLQMLGRQGINRISLGVQSLNDHELQTLGRLHNGAGALEALKMILEAGFTNLSVDVMFGLPGQRAQSFGKTLDTLLSYPITHLSAYSLQLEPGTPLGDEARPMEEEQEEGLWLLLCQKAKEAGFEHYEISNFARPGFAARHNTAYWKGTDYIGLGPAAHSYYQGVRYAFNDSLEDFCRAPWPLQNPQPISEQEAKEERIMLGLRLQEGVALSELPAGFDPARYAPFSRLRQGRFALNERGFYLSNTIIAEILR